MSAVKLPPEVKLALKDQHRPQDGGTFQTMRVEDLEQEKELYASLMRAQVDRRAHNPSFVQVLDSPLVPGQKGLFASVDYEEGDFIGMYTGKHIFPQMLDAVSPNHYQFEVFSPEDGSFHHLVDASSPAESSDLRYVNAPNSSASQNSEWFPVLYDVFLRTTKPISCGSEILAYYGDDTSLMLDPVPGMSPSESLESCTAGATDVLFTVGDLVCRRQKVASAAPQRGIICDLTGQGAHVFWVVARSDEVLPLESLRHHARKDTFVSKNDWQICLQLSKARDMLERHCPPGLEDPPYEKAMRDVSYVMLGIDVLLFEMSDHEIMSNNYETWKAFIATGPTPESTARAIRQFETALKTAADEAKAMCDTVVAPTSPSPTPTPSPK